jgi:hypothetical protein
MHLSTVLYCLVTLAAEPQAGPLKVVVEENVPATMRDGVVLRANVCRPDVTSSDFPNYDRNHNTAADQNADAELVPATQTVHHGGVRASCIRLPVIGE